MADINVKDKTAIGIHHIGMHSHHFDETVRFYEEGLGLTVKHTWGKGERVAMMDAGCGSCIEVFDAGEGETIPEEAGFMWHYIRRISMTVTSGPYEQAASRSSLLPLLTYWKRPRSLSTCGSPTWWVLTEKR